MSDRPLRVLLVGRGRMGRAIESLCASHDAEVRGWLDSANNKDAAGVERIDPSEIDVAIDFSTAAAVGATAPALARRGVNLVIGTTGWQAQEGDVRRAALDAGVGVVAASNFSTGVALFEALVERAAALFAGGEEFGAWIHETHHAAKRDAPSGTALTLQAAMARGGFARPINVASTRAGFVPGTHVIGFDGRFETVTLTHAVRDRAVFAAGALRAAHWVRGRRGWFGIRDVLGLEKGV